MNVKTNRERWRTNFFSNLNSSSFEGSTVFRTCSCIPTDSVPVVNIVGSSPVVNHHCAYRKSFFKVRNSEHCERSKHRVNRSHLKTVNLLVSRLESSKGVLWTTVCGECWWSDAIFRIFHWKVFLPVFESKNWFGRLGRHLLGGTSTRRNILEVDWTSRSTESWT